MRLSDGSEPLMQLSSQHRALLDSTFDSILFVSGNGRIRRANGVAGAMFGASPAELEGLAAETFFSLSGPGSNHSRNDHLAPVPFDPARCDRSTRVTALGLDGRSFPAEIRTSEIDYNGARHFVLCIRELTAELEAKEALQKSESKYRNLFNNMLDCVYQSTADGEILTANPAMVRLIGYDSIDELRTNVRTPQLYRHPEKREQMAKLLSHSQTVRNFEIEIVRKDGGFVTVLANVRAVHGDPEHGTIYEGTMSNISDLIAARAALQHSEEQYRAMTEYALDMVTVLDEQGRALYISPSTTRTTGLQAEEAIGQNVFTSIHREDIASVQAVLEKAFQDPGSPQRFTFRWFHQDGRILYFESVGSAYRTHDGDLRAIVHSRDVTERLRTEAQLQQAQKMQAVGQLTGGIAHDFNNLLTVIVGNLQLLEEKVTGPYELAQVKTALRASMQGAELTRRLLAFSRRQFLEPKVIDVNELLSGMEPIIRRSLNESSRIRTEYTPDAWLTKIDPAQLESALLNLAINAGDSMPYDGELVISTRNCTVQAADLPEDAKGSGGDYVCIVVTDTGCGMSEDVARRAIEPFFSTKDKHGSTGLGLSMVYGFVRQSGGYLRIESKPNAGTSVQIYLPRTRESDREKLPASCSVEMPQGTETIMVVDDNQDVRNSASSLLRSLGYKVIAADHGRSALHLLQTEKISLLFSDVMMPQLSGFELANVARQLQPRIRVLLTTGYTDLSTAREGQAFGTFDVLQKPYTKRDLATRIRNTLDD